MTTSTSSFILLASSIAFLLGCVIPTTHAYASSGVVCQGGFSQVEGEVVEPETVCALAEMYGPSPAQMEDGTVMYIGGYSWNYDILDLTGTTPEDVMADQAAAMSLPTIGTKIVITQDDNSACNVTVNDQPCDFCTVCGNTDPPSINVDCSMVEGGRALTGCEPVVDVFYPFEGYYPTAEIVQVDGGSSNGPGENVTVGAGNPEEGTTDPAFRPSIHVSVMAIVLLSFPISGLLL